MPLLTVKNLKTYYFLKNQAVKAVDGINFTLEKGQSLGIAGESGCGKSTVCLSLMRLIKGGKIVDGSVTLNGTSLLDMPIHEFNRIRWEKISIVSQAAMGALNPVFRIGQQIVEAIVNHRDISKADAWSRTEELLKQVEIDPARAKNYPHELSGGMRQRAMIAMALALDPEIIIADEPTTALDVITQAQVIKLIRKLQRTLDVSVIFISHDLSILAQACDRIMIMYAGKMMELGDTKILFKNPKHPYTTALLQSFPDIKRAQKGLTGLSGSPPNLIDPPLGCRFHPRCPQGIDVCEQKEPAIIEHPGGHFVACHLVEKGEDV